MDAHDYLDWSRMAGLYLRNISHVDRYRTLQPLLSSAGLTTVIVGEFLENTDPIVDVVAWRTHSVYEIGAEQQERITCTAAALEAIGATRVGVAVRTAQSNSPFGKITELLSQGNLKSVGDFRELTQGMKGIDLLNHMRESVARNMPDLADQVGIHRQVQSPPVNPAHESREQIESLLEKFVAAHRSELNRDLNRHGDPRQTPGYSREGRVEEIDRLRKRLFAAEAQQRDAATLRELIDQIRKLAGNPGEGSKKAQSKLEQLRLKFRALHKEHRATAVIDLIPEMESALKTGEVLMASLPEIFAPKKLGDDKLNARLEALGEYETEHSGGNFEIQWDDPRGLRCDWTSLSLRVCYRKARPQLLERLLDAVDRLRQQWQQRLDEWRDQLITTFRDVYWVQMNWQLDDYEVDEEGDATDESILGHVDSGQIVLEIDPEGDSIHATTYFNVDWDDEHGFEINWETDGAEGNDQSIDLTPAVESLGLQDAGPGLTSADIIRFESTFHLELPTEYRQFLLSANGGRPRRHALTASISGEKFPANVVQFFPLKKCQSEPFPAGSLEAAIQHARDRNWPSTLLPIAEARNAGLALTPEQATNFLVIVLSGAKAGRVLLANPDAMTGIFPGLRAEAAEGMAAAMMGQLVDHAPTAGRSLTEFLGKLKEPEADDSPAWLKAIREDDITAFLSWIQSGGKCEETFQERGVPVPLQVIDYLACHASANLLKCASEQKFFKPGKLRDSWARITQRDIRRFKVLMQVLPADMWKSALSSHQVWEHPDLWEELATAGVAVNEPVDDEGQTPIQLAVQQGKTAAVKWLMQHGADPFKFDKYQRNAFTWTDRGPGYDCLAILEGRENVAPPRTPQADTAGIEQLNQAAMKLPNGTSLVVVIQIKSPPVTEAEKRWSSECHYRLTFDIQRRQVTFNSMTSPRQDYLHADEWPSVLFVPILQWPQLTPLWETLEVQEFDWNLAMKKRNYQPSVRSDLLDAARDALHQSLNAEEAAARTIRLRK